MPILNASPAIVLRARTTRSCACSCPILSEQHMPPTLSISPRLISNRLLAGLAPRELDTLMARLEPVPLPHKQTLSNPGASIEDVYFIEEGMVSLVQPLEGGMIEVGMIGREGFVGVPVLL